MNTLHLPRPRQRESLIVGLALLAIAAWGWLGVDRTILDELGGTVSLSHRRAFAAEGPYLPQLPFPPSGPEALGVQPALGIAGGFGDGSSGGPPAELVAQGLTVFEANGCYACHTTDGTEKIGPSLLGLWGTEQSLEDGSAALMDADYFYESVLQPQARIVSGFVDAAMPSYEGLVTEDDLEALAAYVESLR
jgi:mono/diheme cytochrome c family protein